MNEKLVQLKNRFVTFWKKRTKSQKGIIIGSLLAVIAIIAITTAIAGKTNFVPLYSNLSPQETGQIKAELDSKGFKSEIAANGTTIKVPEDVVDTLKVQLAAEGIPNSGSIDYSFFGKNAGFGMTDNEFNVLKLDATQTELSNLIKEIDGVQDAKVMINLPDPNVFVGDDKGTASASVVLNTKPGYKFDDNQIKALYHLVSKSVPNLSTDNIVIMNQYFEYYDLKDENNSTDNSLIENQLNVKKEVERDIQRRVQQMLGTMMGQDKVVVSVTADLDFTQEKSVENLVTPVDPDKMKGLEISAQKITETYSGKGAKPGGLTSNQSDIPTYQGSDSSSNGDYERVEETINNEVNHIKKNIVESPYKVRDLGIQVMVEPPKANDPSSLPQQRVDDIKQILGTIVRTTIDTKDNPGLTDQDVQKKVVVSVEPFNGKIKFNNQTNAAIPYWIYIVGGALLLIIIGLIILLFRRNRKKEDALEEEIYYTPPVVPDLSVEHETEGSLRRKQLEKMAKEKPDEFAKLLRSWLTED